MMPVRRARFASRCQHRNSTLSAKDLGRELGSAVLDACRSLWCEFVELSLLEPKSFDNNEQELLHWYAEVRYQIDGRGGHCTQCRAHVRHAIPLRVEIDDAIRDFPCLCTRCIVGFEYQADRIWYTVAGKFIEHPVRCARSREKAA